MNKLILNSNIKAHRLEMDEVVKELHQLTIDIGHDELARTVSELRNRINEPFMFVIVGEVKAGKSSFINALLDTGEEVCKVAPDPCTDSIQQIIYGEEEANIVLNEHLRKIVLPVEILKEIAIVDTPGTNAIIAHHQEITENFIPGSDLIVFVFEAKNPYRQSAWEFFDYIHSDWRKKIIFVLQQKDLVSDSDLEVNIAGVQKQAEKKGLGEANVFAVSAKQELEGEKEVSGFQEVRAFITDNITGGQAPVLKLKNNIETSLTISDKIRNGIDLRGKQYRADMNFREDVKNTLDEQEVRSNKQVEVMVENLLAEYDKITRKSKLDLEEGLGFFTLIKRSFSSMFSSGNSFQDWLTSHSEELKTNLGTSLTKKLNEGVYDIADSIQQMAKMIDLKIKNSETILKNNHDIFGDIGDRRSAVLHELQSEFAGFMENADNFTGADIFDEEVSFTPGMATGSGIAAIGVVITAVAHATVADVTGGIITAVGLLFAGITVTLKRGKILKEYQSTIETGRTKLEKEITDKLKTYIANIKVKIDQNFGDFDAMLENERSQLAKLEEQQKAILNRIEGIKVEMG